MQDAAAAALPARPEHAEALFALVNAAYAVELGDAGLAFKNCDRYLSVADVARDIASGGFLVTADAADGAVTGCVLVSTTGERGTFGPLAVLPGRQGAGLGGRLVRAAESAARARGAAYVEIDMVNHRTDLVAFYEHLGYARSGTAPCDAAHNCDEAKLTRPAHFVLMRKTLLEASEAEVPAGER